MLRLILNRNFRSERPARALYTSFALLRKEAAAGAAGRAWRKLCDSRIIVGFSSPQLWRYGATVSTRPFQGRNTGSIPVSATNSLKQNKG
jgi:hypothetical protein